MTRTSKKFLSSILLGCVMAISAPNNAFAANQNFINQISNEYSKYESNISNDYQSFKQTTTTKFEEFEKEEYNSFAHFSNQTKKDVEKLDQLLQADLENLKNKYDGNSAYSLKLRDYGNKINSDYLASPMQKYANSINPDYLNSFMMKYKNAVNENYLNSPMMKYKNAVNENYLNSSMMKYKNAVNADFLNSPMFKLKNGSNVNFLNSIMFQYNNGKIGQQEASKQWKALLQKENKAIQGIEIESTQSIQQIAGDSKDTILKQKYETVNGILKQREQTLDSIAKAHAEYFGEELSLDPLIPDLGKINVIIDREWQGFKQSATVMNGATLVPMRAIFEKLGAEVKWHPEKQTITASKRNTTVSLLIDSNKATINGKPMTLAAAPRLINGNTMVPLRFVSESLGADVEWDGQNKTVFISSK
ncbi:copper amine oxidase N-terminal domain-containing protein [Schinkia sp. CFF1]